MYRFNLNSFCIEGKTLEKKEILNISESSLEASFLSNFNILVGLESNEDMTFFIPVLSLGSIKNKKLDLLLRKSEKCLCENEIFSFVLLAIEEK